MFFHSFLYYHASSYEIGSSLTWTQMCMIPVIWAYAICYNCYLCDTKTQVARPTQSCEYVKIVLLFNAIAFAVYSVSIESIF